MGTRREPRCTNTRSAQRLSRRGLLWGLAFLCWGCGGGQQTSGDAGRLSAIAASDEWFVTVGTLARPPSEGASSAIFASRDGTRWSVVALPRTDGSLWDVAASGETFVAVGPGRAGNSQVVTGTVGGSWQVVLNGANLGQVVSGNGRFLTGAGVEAGNNVSTDGSAWTAVTVPVHDGLAFDEREFVGFGRLPGSFSISQDGISWTAPAASADPTLNGIFCVATVGEQVLGFGSARCSDPLLSQGCSVVQLLGPKEGDVWELSSTLPAFASGTDSNDELRAIASDGQRAVVVSPNTIHVTPLPIGSQPWTDLDVRPREWSLADVAYRDGTFVVVGSRRGGASMLVATSADGATWTEVSLP